MAGFGRRKFATVIVCTPGTIGIFGLGCDSEVGNMANAR